MCGTVSFCMILPLLVRAQNIIHEKVCTSDIMRYGEEDFYHLENTVQKQSDLLNELLQRVKALEMATQTDNFRQQKAKDSGQFGREFVLSFPEIHTSVKNIQLLIVSTEDGTVKLETKFPGIVNRSVSIVSNKGLIIDLPSMLIRVGSYVDIRTLFVKSSTDIAIFVVELGQSGTGDGYIGIPAKSMKTKYYFAMDQNAMLSIVSLHNNTQIHIESITGTQINLKRIGLSRHGNITLNLGEVMQIKHHNWVIGYVEGSKPFMFLYGSYTYQEHANIESVIDSVPYTSGRFFIIPFLSTSGTQSVMFCNTPNNDKVESNQRVRRNPDYLFLTDIKNVTYIKSDLNTSCTYIGHGFSVSIPPVSLFGTYCRYITPYQSNFTHYAVILTKVQFMSGIKFRNVKNDTEISSTNQSTITTLNGNSYAAMYYTVTAGQYEVWNEIDDATIGMIAYGFGIGTRTAYGFSVCFKGE